MSGADPFLAVLQRVLAGERLSPAEARLAFEAVMDGLVSPPRLAALLVALRMRGETVEEIGAFARTMRARALPVRTRHPEVLDTCGTGGDGAGTFNVSTVAALVVAAAGVPVAKHGNRAVSGRCGSADLLEGLGVRADLSAEEAAGCLDDLNFGFLFAPRLHPSVGHAAAVRRDLGVRTVFNLLGPLANPAGARRQLLGVYDSTWVVPLARVLLDLGATRALVVHGAGTDEIALHGETMAAEVLDGRVVERRIVPEEAGLKRAPIEAIAGGDIAAQVEAARRVLDGDLGPKRDIVILNAGAALMVAGRAGDIAEGARLAAETIDRGLAAALVETLRRRTPLDRKE
jgi:anthranilate phosphoribosyltransferase